MERGLVRPRNTDWIRKIGKVMVDFDIIDWYRGEIAIGLAARCRQANLIGTWFYPAAADLGICTICGIWCRGVFLVCRTTVVRRLVDQATISRLMSRSMLCVLLSCSLQVAGMQFLLSATAGWLGLNTLLYRATDAFRCAQSRQRLGNAQESKDYYKDLNYAVRYKFVHNFPVTRYQKVPHRSSRGQALLPVAPH